MQLFVVVVSLFLKTHMIASKTPTFQHPSSGSVFHDILEYFLWAFKWNECVQ